MDTNSWMNLAYLLLLLAAVGGWMIVQNRQRLGKMAQQAAVWVLIFVGRHYCTYHLNFIGK